MKRYVRGHRSGYHNGMTNHKSRVGKELNLVHNPIKEGMKRKITEGCQLRRTDMRDTRHFEINCSFIINKTSLPIFTQY